MDSGAAFVAESGATSAAPGQLDFIRAVVAQQIGPHVEAIDREGHYPERGLRALGAAGAFASHLAAFTHLPQRSLAASIDAMTAMGEVCMSTAFCAWCQDACGWYLENTDNAGLRDRLQPGIALGTTLGGTGLSNPVKALSGIEGFKLRATRTDGGYLVSGVLPWVSNLGDGHWFGTIFEDASDPSHKLMGMVQCGAPGVEIRQSAHFIALEGTGTYGIMFRRAFVPDENLLADPLGDMMQRIRPGFVLLQTGMGFGVIAGAIAQMRRDDVSYRHTNQYLPKGADDYEAESAALRSQVADLADNPGQGRDYLRAVLQARLAVSELTLDAAQASVLHAGARGYLEGSSVFRRQREATFVAIITPSIRHLRQEIAALSTN